ncbi:MAG: TonB-dependent receptor [Spongiibacteraceae bacterium]
MNFSKQKPISLAVIGAALVLAHNAAHAQDSAPKARSIEEVIVTSRRVEESQQDIPLAVTAFTSEALQAAGVNNLSDLKSIPSFTLAPLSGRSTTLTVQLRGQRNSDATTSVDPAVGVYLAEVPIMRTFGIGAMSALDVQSMEVVKGPQGTLFGRNTTGGALLITPNAPTQHIEGSVALGIGNYNRKTAELMFNAPITDVAAGRIAIRKAMHDGYINNRSDFADINDEDSIAARASLLLEPTDTLTNTTFADYFDHDSHSGAKLRSIAPGSSQVRTTYGSATLAQALNEADNSDFWSTRSLNDSPTSAEGMGLTNITTYELSDSLTIKNIFGYREVEAIDTKLESMMPSFPVNISDQTAKTNQYSEELQLQGAMDRLDWIVGLFLFKENSEESGTAYSLATTWPPAIGPNIVNLEVENISKSIFGQGNYAFTDSLSLTLGARWTEDKRELDVLSNINYRNPAAPVCSLTATNVPPLISLSPCTKKVSKDFSAPSYNISLDYKLDDRQLVYLAHRSGYRSGGFTTTAQRPLQFEPFDKETVKDIELGYKADFDIFETPLRVNAAYYYSDYKDIQRNVAEIAPGGTQIVNTVKNAGSATIQGLELETTWLPIDALEIGAFYTYTDAGYDEFESLSSAGVVQDLSKNEFAPVPEHQGGLNVTYTYALGEAGELRFLVGGYWQSRVAGNVVNRLAGTDIDIPGAFQSGYGLYNARITWNDIYGQPLSISLWGKNLTDTEYYTSTTTQYETLGLASGYFGEPRTFGLDARYSF